MSWEGTGGGQVAQLLRTGERMGAYLFRCARLHCRQCYGQGVARVADRWVSY